VGKKINKTIILNKNANIYLYRIANSIYSKYYQKKVVTVTIKTFCKIKQAEYKSGDQIDIKQVKEMFQKIET
jgi:hypothetical protein